MTATAFKRFNGERTALVIHVANIRKQLRSEFSPPPNAKFAPAQCAHLLPSRRPPSGNAAPALPSKRSASGSAAHLLPSRRSPSGNAARLLPSRRSPWGNAARALPSRRSASGSVSLALPRTRPPSPDKAPPSGHRAPPSPAAATLLGGAQRLISTPKGAPSPTDCRCQTPPTSTGFAHSKAPPPHLPTAPRPHPAPPK